MSFAKADRIASIALSEIVQLSEAAAAKRAAGEDVLSLGTGEPDFPTPPHVIAAANQAALKGETRYPPTAGTPALRAAIAEVAGTAPANVIVSTGAKQVIANAFAASLNQGDEVILPTPFWTSYRDVIGMFGGTATIVETNAKARFKLSPDALEAAITPRTKWLLLNSPSNPSGMIYTPEELAALGKVLERHPHVWVMADEIYEHISYIPFTSFTKAVPALAARSLIVNGVSKAHSMTGWRIGWGIGPQDLIDAMTTVQGQITSGASSVSQAAALAALTGPQDHLATRCALFQKRRDKVFSAINAIDGLSAILPDGAFYLFACCAQILGPNDTDADFCAHVLAASGLVVVPGRAFGMPGHFRLSYAYSDAELDDAMTRLAQAAQTYVSKDISRV
ncbi:pyridoxal phosphate-dependent aminotransferase [Sulfitobacter donghicola]|uniref:Aminotransferase n=1 Tax=Sulfitobacter donghicola DSW-25 = KCTC 12864 = JCM 14565 TaxID=1300350 RepID=A0A073IE79_9RHOB|nr:pyridoxal phosphate-dependent aminotransferase [Sulfitobacter donghicola]KEJ87875.1 aspartate aminotransferase [Sulfitobacter donghicola DSW-25 = KCTC 12864 = JCM 14565]KIN67278.1 Aspartate aminotransferase A [Sulfitobacter donghicola DSW-25 = KCTC 12864 = JCM 14565]